MSGGGAALVADLETDGFVCAPQQTGYGDIASRWCQGRFVDTEYNLVVYELPNGDLNRVEARIIDVSSDGFDPKSISNELGSWLEPIYPGDEVTAINILQTEWGAKVGSGIAISLPASGAQIRFNEPDPFNDIDITVPITFRTAQPAQLPEATGAAAAADE